MYIDHTYNKLAAAFEIMKKFADSKWVFEIDILKNLHFFSVGSVQTSLKCCINCLGIKKTNSFLIHIDSYTIQKMGGLFSNPKTLKQVIREQKRVNNKAIRSLDREIRGMDREMNRAQKDMKKLAQEGQMKAVKILAKDYMRMQQSRTKFIELKAQLRSLSSQMEVMHAQEQMQSAMKNMSKLMHAVSNRIKLPELQKSMARYQMEMEKQNVKQELMADMMDDAFEVDEDDEDELIQKVFDEIGLELGEQLEDAPKGKTQEPAQVDKEDDNLEARLNNLKR